MRPLGDPAAEDHLVRLPRLDRLRALEPEADEGVASRVRVPELGDARPDEDASQQQAKPHLKHADKLATGDGAGANGRIQASDDKNVRYP